MPTYVVLVQFTDQGRRNLATLAAHMRENLERAETAGLKITGPYLTLGEYDQVAIVESPDAPTAPRGVLGLVEQGNLRTRTLRAFTLEEVRQVLGEQGRGIWSS
jgi:uncharacterized protein with GYD domain